jgi:LPS O-antigen subunit length determinant protein (WzzB/FepE family)
VEDIKRKDTGMSDEQQNKHTQEEEIDLLELALKVWAERRWILKCCGYAVIVGLVIAFSIPKEYTTSVMIAPEASDNKGGGLSSLASLAGINLNTSSGSDAIYPDLYPDIVSSTPFVTGLFDVPVRDMDGEINTTLYDYMDEYQRMPWWSYIISAPFKALSWTISLFKESEEEVDKLDPFQLTKEQTDIVKALSDHIGVSVDKKTGVTTISVTMQDPRISACLTDTVVNRLQSYIIDYRTNKARKDFHFQEKLFERKKKEYEQAQENYAKFADANKNIILQSYRAEQVRLENEMNLAYQVYTSVAQQLQMAEAYNVYTQVAQQLQMAKAKVQEITPVYTVVEPATIPVKASKPNKVMILLGVVFLVGIVCVSWILLGRRFIDTFRGEKYV